MGNVNMGCISASTSASWATAGGFPIQTYLFSRDGFRSEDECRSTCTTEFVGARQLFDNGPNAAATGLECTCYNNQAKPYDYVAGTDLFGSCFPADVTYYKRQTSFAFPRCRVVPATLPPAIIVPSIPACYQECSGFQGATVIFSATDEVFQCFCQPNVAFGNEPSTRCQPGVAYSFEHLGYPQSSGLARRQERKEAEVRRRRLGRGGDLEYCPAGLSACRVGAGDELGYECLDTKSELESCGGCTSGLFGSQDLSSSLGLNCATMTGTVFGGNTCEQGTCVAMACQDGYYLEDGACIGDLD